MAELRLHAGTRKAGSTSLQRTLKTNAGRISAQGGYYPTHLEINQKSLFREMLAKPARFDELPAWQSVLEGFAASGSNRLLLSAEDMFTLPEVLGPVAFAEAATRLRGLFDDVRVLLVLRPPVDYCDSWYNQLVRLGAYVGELTLKDFVASIRGQLRYDEVVLNWQREIGRDRITVEAMTDPRAPILQRCLEFFEVERDHGWNLVNRANVKPHPDVVRYLAHLGQQAADKLRVEVPGYARLNRRIGFSEGNRKLKELALRGADGGYTLVPLDVARELVSYGQEVNARLSALVPGFPPDSFSNGASESHAALDVRLIDPANLAAMEARFSWDDVLRLMQTR